MPGSSTKRIRHDAFDAGDVSVRCSCWEKGTLLVLPLARFMVIGTDAALRLADEQCPRCAPAAIEEQAG